MRADMCTLYIDNAAKLIAYGTAIFILVAVILILVAALHTILHKLKDIREVSRFKREHLKHSIELERTRKI